MTTKKVVGVFTVDSDGNGRIDIIPQPGKEGLDLGDGEIKIAFPREKLCHAEPL